MESQLFDPSNGPRIVHTLGQLIEACRLIVEWNKQTVNAQQYVTSLAGMQVMSASCMMIENIGEGIKKIDRLAPKLLMTLDSNVPWRNIKGLRDQIAHGYFNLDEEIIFDVVKNEIPKLKQSLNSILNQLGT